MYVKIVLRSDPVYWRAEIGNAESTSNAITKQGRTRVIVPSRFSRFLALLDQFPELARFAELLIFRDRQFAPEKKIPKRVLVQDAVNGDPFRRLREVDPIIFGAITI